MHSGAVNGLLFGIGRGPAMALSLPRLVAPLVIVAAWPTVAPTAAADPLPPVAGGQAASVIIDDLQAQGYDVQINWLTGYDTKPLSDCRVTGVNDPGNSAPSADTFTTVYVDVVCPNGDDGGFGFGAGLG